MYNLSLVMYATNSQACLLSATCVQHGPLLSIDIKRMFYGTVSHFLVTTTTTATSTATAAAATATYTIVTNIKLMQHRNDCILPSALASIIRSNLRIHTSQC